MLHYGGFTHSQSFMYKSSEGLYFIVKQLIHTQAAQFGRIIVAHGDICTKGTFDKMTIHIHQKETSRRQIALKKCYLYDTYLGIRDLHCIWSAVKSQQHSLDAYRIPTTYLKTDHFYNFVFIGCNERNVYRHGRIAAGRIYLFILTQ